MEVRSVERCRFARQFSTTSRLLTRAQVSQKQRDLSTLHPSADTRKKHPDPLHSHLLLVTESH
jgi:hypothetical protein